MWWWSLNRKQKLRRAAAALWSTPLIMLFPVWYGTLYEPSLILEYPTIFILFFGLPFLAAAILYWIAAKATSE